MRAAVHESLEKVEIVYYDEKTVRDLVKIPGMAIYQTSEGNIIVWQSTASTLAFKPAEFWPWLRQSLPGLMDESQEILFTRFPELTAEMKRY